MYLNTTISTVLESYKDVSKWIKKEPIRSLNRYLYSGGNGQKHCSICTYEKILIITVLFILYSKEKIMYRILPKLYLHRK